MDAPRRIQLSRAKGWRMPENTVRVDRATKWGNPWRIEGAREVGFAGSDEHLAGVVVDMFRNGVRRRLPAVGYGETEVRAALAGKHLACWCKSGAPCHADVLLEIANRPVCEAVR
ncbi:DUF4326 domain-containing protein [Xanthobacter autotrophicus]|uniref:DUF4326 domain-containing protein n=1 Tax=Xanthobacter autotrophicus TaxID=280 RepID=UPI00372C8E66